MRKFLNYLRAKIIGVVIFVFLFNSIGPIHLAQADDLSLPVPGVMVKLSPEYTPAYLKALIIHPENALRFDFLIAKGDLPLKGQAKHDTYQKLIKYFLASLAVPDENQWVTY